MCLSLWLLFLSFFLSRKSLFVDCQNKSISEKMLQQYFHGSQNIIFAVEKMGTLHKRVSKQGLGYLIV